MKKLAIPILLLLAACAATPKQRELQYVQSLKTAQNLTVTALDNNIISADDGAKIHALLQVAIADLRRAVDARRKGAPRAVTDRILDAVEAALVEATRLINKED